MNSKILPPCLLLLVSATSHGITYDLFEETENSMAVADFTLDLTGGSALGSNESGSIQAVANGGPDGSSYLQFNNSWTAGDGGNSSVGNYWLFDDWTYDPSSITVAGDIDFFGSVDIINDPDNIGAGVIAKQNGNYHFSFYDPNIQATWNTISGTNTTGLTTSGGLIEFGIFTANSTTNNTGLPVNHSKTSGLDNFSVKLTSAVPEPSSALLVGLGSLSLLRRRR